MRLWGGLVVVFVILAACRGGGDASFTSSAGGAGSGPVIGSGSSGATGTGDAPVPVDASIPEMPFVACSVPDAAAGADADVADADADSPPISEDGGADDSPCATPPPAECASKTMMVVWNPGACDGVQCVFESTFESCPGGCFRQMDGGTGCNP